MLPDPPKPSIVAPRCLSIDLEVGLKDERIHHFAAVRGDSDLKQLFNGGNLNAALDQLDDMADAVAFLLGHNLIDFDLPHLAAARPGLRLLKLPAVDTLRLNPLAFPRNPYHRLVKHYQDGRLQRGQLNDPELDARLALQVLADQMAALQASAPELLLAWHWLTADGDHASGLNALFITLRRQRRPSDAEGRAAILHRLDGQTCQNHAAAIVADAARHGWALAYALAWLSVAGGNSVMPPWVCHQFPQAGRLVRLLRDSACADPACRWCAERHDPLKELKRWFGHDAFRPLPRDSDGQPMQQSIVAAAMAGRHVLGILPTGTGKSLCYQVPALSRYDKTGALTVVVSPLVALMQDQVAGLQAKGITCSVAINGMLSMPERADALDRVRLGDIGILIISPEQLRNQAVRKVLAQREIGAWVLDEAHCISKWGHDFRPDYRYVARFIGQRAATGPVPPVLCLTATAKPDVVSDMLDHFRKELAIDLLLFNGGAERSNLTFDIVPTTAPEKFGHIFQLLEHDLAPAADHTQRAGGAIVYCASRRQTEEIAAFLREKGLPAGHFHAGLTPDLKQHTQRQFIDGALQVIVATNAFGMGIDKPDVRLVIHADIPGSMENYQQEAGRAGRDQAAARCVLLYTAEDVERQFSLSAHARLTQREIQAVLRALKNLNRRKHLDGKVIATTGEILAEDRHGAFERDSATDDNRVRTAISWLEEARLLTRDENHVHVFPSSLRVATLEQAQQKLATLDLFEDYRRQLLALVQALIGADADDGISTDELMGVSGLTGEQVRAALYALEKCGIASNDTALTAFVHSGIERSSQKRYDQAAALEQALIATLRDAAPDLRKGEHSLAHLRPLTQSLKDAGHTYALPEKLSRLLVGLGADGRGDASGTGSLLLKRRDAETIEVTLQRDWAALSATAALRREAAGVLLRHLLTQTDGQRGADILAETTLGQLHGALTADLHLQHQVKDSAKLLDRALLWLHEQEVIRLNKGLAVFRPAMSIALSEERRNFVKADFAPLQLHYQEQVVQIHVMAEYVARGLQTMADAWQLTRDYFRLERDAFLQLWLPGRDHQLLRQTTPASWRAIVEALNDPAQQKIVTDEREQTNVLVLAGPGSGKTRVLVHRIAYLVRVKRENPRTILALAYNRHAAGEIRRRLDALLGDDARGVVVLTCHAFAMRLAGASFAGRAGADEKTVQEAMREVMLEALAVLRGDGLAADEADGQREQLLAAFRWILVDEYQDIGAEQYQLIAALAGRTRSEEDGKLSLFAVGDDDQNIYAFDGASVEFIRQFEQDYAAKPAFLTENYRSSGHIIEAANHLIGPARARMKLANPITINRARARLPAGGPWAQRDPIGKGRVQIIAAGHDRATQAVAVMTELRRLAACDTGWDWSRVAVIAREWKLLEPLRSYCELHAIPVQLADEGTPHFWRLRETQTLVQYVRAAPGALLDPPALQQWLASSPHGPWWALVRAAVDAYALETAAAELPREHFIEWLAEWGRELRQRQSGLLLLTAHRAKGLEFDHVAVLDGGWERDVSGQPGSMEDADAPRRLLYVAMTRASQTLTLARMQRQHRLLDPLPQAACLVRRAAVVLPAPAPELARCYQRLTPKHVHLGYAGNYPQTDGVHDAIAALVAGDPLVLRRGTHHWELDNVRGITVGRLARGYTPPPAMRCCRASVYAIVVRRRSETEAPYSDRVRCDQWQVVLPELVFEPDH